ncbi:PREDICTED: uncharacterized protein LOC109147511 [Ipomoea nil]|uniref:uncharacterized protein LOC109147511 n=1 Tax=Ipomoea nil TaxID=35883 RepID=UPI00090187E6|nr:PREDICTED: uncharacterized protein LOC109147511 [Ipomoea nil]
MLEGSGLGYFNRIGSSFRITCLDFEELFKEHFRRRCYYILKACDAYIEKFAPLDEQIQTHHFCKFSLVKRPNGAPYINQGVGCGEIMLLIIGKEMMKVNMCWNPILTASSPILICLFFFFSQLFLP